MMQYYRTSTLFLSILLLAIDGIEAQSCLPPTGLDVLPSGVVDAARGALASGALPYLWLPMAETLIGQVTTFETPIQFRIAQSHASAVYNVAAKYHPVALDFWGRDVDRICQDGDADYLSLHESVAMAYAFYYSASNVIPVTGELLKPIIESFLGPAGGLPTNLLFADDPLDPSTPWGLAKKTVDEWYASIERDGWNADGTLAAEYNSFPFQDFGIVGDNGVVYEPYEVQTERTAKQWPWQPLLESDGKGFFSKQEYVAPYIGFTGRLYGMDKVHYESFTAPPPNYNYQQEARAVLERTRVMASSDKQKMLLQFFDSKFTSLLPFQINWSIMSHASEYDFWYYDMVLVNTMHDALLLVWKEKIVHNAVRPTTVVHELLKEKMVNTYAGPYLPPMEIKAKEWQPFIRTMPHAEYPSGSACICTAFAETFQLMTGKDEIDFPLEYFFDAGSSLTEKGVTPANNLTLTYTAWSDIAHDCGQSRLYGGMHFEAAVTASHELCSGFINPVVEKAELLRQGNADGALATFGDDSILVTPLERPAAPADDVPVDAVEPRAFYPNWGGLEEKCLDNSVETENMPGYMRTNYNDFVSDDLETCCARHYDWAKADCIVNSGGTYAGSSEWYVNWVSLKCVKDCNDSSDANCGGFAKNWDKLFGDSVADCCGDISPDLTISECIET